MEAAPPPRVGTIMSGAVLMANGQRVRSAGRELAFHGRPVDLAPSPDGKTLYAKDNRGLVVVDANGWKVRQELAFPNGGGGSLHGLAVSRDGQHVYATTAQNALMEAGVQPNGTLTWQRTIVLPGPGKEANPYPCGLALTRDGQRAWVCLSRNNALGLVDLQTGTLVRQIAVGVAPWDVWLSPDERTVWVTNWGGRLPRPGERTAPSSGTPTLIDGRGVASSGTLSYVEAASGRELAQVAVGLHPCALTGSRNGRTLYVACANSDTVCLVDTEARKVRQTISVRPNSASRFGAMPDALALSPDGRTLYAANGGSNALAVIALPAGKGEKASVRGFVPTGWYPGSVICDAHTLYTANIKGSGGHWREPAKPKANSNGGKAGGESVKNAGYNVYDATGTLSRIPLPNATELRAYTAQVRRSGAGVESRNPGTPQSTKGVFPAAVRHVLYIIKENRTYDQVLGDLKQGDGDPNLCLYGRAITPNHHALAEQFVLLDNFYCNGVLSADGHSWATEGNVTDHLERAFGGFTRSYTFGDDPLTYSASGFLWDNVLAHGLTFRNYGEMDYTNETPDVDYGTIYRDWAEKTGKITFAHNIGIANLKRYSCPDALGWNMDIADVIRADVFIRELHEAEKRGTWPNLTILYLPNDHTTGTTPGDPTPRAYLADNDLALGRVVEAVSHSRFWPSTAIFVTEDDPQAGFDHVDGHRSLCLVVSPWARRNRTVHQFYNQTSVLHSIEGLLHLPPMNQMDALAPSMQGCFTNKIDSRPYICLPSSVPIGETTPKRAALRGAAQKWARRSEGLDFSRPDQAGEDTLNRALWWAAKGGQPYPAPLAGAHGRGLARRGLRLARGDNDVEESTEGAARGRDKTRLKARKAGARHGG